MNCNDYPICDNCKHYIDAGNNGRFFGYGHCDIDYEETTAADYCEEFFVCFVCQNEILRLWSCL